MSGNGKVLLVQANGIRPLLLSRPPKDVKSEAKQGPEDKFELDAEKRIIIRDTRLKSGLHTDFTKKMCVTRRHYDSKTRGAMGLLMWGLLDFDPPEIPLMRDGKPIIFKGFGENGIVLDARNAFGKGTPVWTERPCIELPWYLEWKLTVYETDEYDANAARTDFVRLGNIGIGAFNHVFGKFRIDKWEEIES